MKLLLTAFDPFGGPCHGQQYARRRQRLSALHGLAGVRREAAEHSKVPVL